MFYNIRYDDIIPTVVTYPNPNKTSNDKNIPDVKKYYPNPNIYVNDYPNPNIYVNDYPNPNIYVNDYYLPEINPYNTIPIYPRIRNEPSVYEYQNVNKDENLRKEVVKFFQEKIIKWTETKEKFAKFKSHKNEIESKKGYDKIYKIIRQFVNHKKYNWYDLRENYEDLRKYIASELEF